MKINHEIKKTRPKSITKIREIVAITNVKIVTEEEMIEVRKNREKFIKRIEAIF